MFKNSYMGDSAINRIKDGLRAGLYGLRFEAFITALIVLNAIVLGALTYEYQSSGAHREWVSFLIAVDVGIILIFALEIALKIFVDGRKFFESGWNIFDFLVVAIGIFGAGYPLSIVRSLRILRTFRLIRRVPSMRVVVESFLRSLSGIASVLTVMLIVIFVYSVIGTRLFGETAPKLFGTLHTSAFTMFTVLTLEGWPDVARQVMAKHPWSWFYFVSYIAINSFAVFNLLIAVIITSMHKEYDTHAEEEREDILEELQALRHDMKRLLESKKQT